MGESANRRIPSLTPPSLCISDPGEHVNVAKENADVVAELWAALNTTILGARDCQGWSYKGTPGKIPGPVQPDGTTSCSPPELLGKCDTKCAQAKWKTFGNDDGPICGVPGCT